MRNFMSLLYSKLTIGFIISIIFTFAFGFSLRYIYEHFYSIVPVIGGITKIDISFYSLVTSFKLLFTTFLEYLLEDTYTIPIGDMLAEKRKYTFLMDNNAKDSPGESSSKTPSKVHYVDKTLQLTQEFGENLSDQRKMIHRMRDLKLSKNLRYFLDSNGGLELDAPSNISDKELKDLSKQVGIMDRIINTKRGEYEKLQVRDLMAHGSMVSNSCSKMNEQLKNEYKDLFEKK